MSGVTRRAFQALCGVAITSVACSSRSHTPPVYRVNFETTKGPFSVEVIREWSPLGADRFYDLVKQGYFTDNRFFRVLPGFIVQFGISGDPAISKKWKTATIDDDPVKQSNQRGFVSFATGGPLTRTTQLFINLADNKRLDTRGFSPFGKVVSGMEVIDRLYSGYGEGAPRGSGPDQARIEAEGNAYLDKNFPRLDSIKSAKIDQGKEGKT